MLQKIMILDTEADLSQAFDKLTQPAVNYKLPSLSHVVSKATTRVKLESGESPVSEPVLNEILQVCLFKML